MGTPPELVPSATGWWATRQFTPEAAASSMALSVRVIMTAALVTSASGRPRPGRQLRHGLAGNARAFGDDEGVVAAQIAGSLDEAASRDAVQSVEDILDLDLFHRSPISFFSA